MISGSDPRPNTQPEIVIERVFDGPPALVWKTWTDPEHVMRWWGPKGFTSPVCKADFRVGGSYLYCMRSPQGKDFWTTGVYLEIVEPVRIVYTDCFSDADGNLVPASRWGLAERNAGHRNLRRARRQDERHPAACQRPRGPHH